MREGLNDSLLYLSVANGEPPIGIPWETFQKYAKFSSPIMKEKEINYMEKEEIYDIIDKEILKQKEIHNKSKVFMKMSIDDEDYFEYQQSYFRSLGAMNSLRCIKSKIDKYSNESK